MAITTSSLIRESTSKQTAVDWDAIYERELPRVYNFLRYRVRDAALAQDLTAATFEKAWRARGQYKPKRAAASTWLFTIASNVARDHYRQQRPVEDIDSIDTLEISDRQLPEQIVQQKQELAQLERILVSLPEREQEIISLKFGAELSNKQIARVMDLSALHIGVILFRTLRKLRIKWENER